jgi:DNA-binding transcriptional ArsR family regulator
MPAPIRDILDQPPTQDVSVALEAAQNVFYSMTLMVREDRKPGLNEWVQRTREAMTLEEQQRHRMVTWGLYYAIEPEPGWQSFLSYVDHLASMAPAALQDKLLNTYARIKKSETECTFERKPAAYDKQRVLSSFDSYLAFQEEHFQPDNIEADLEAQAYVYVKDPPAMKDLIVNHLRWMWEKYLSAEWTRVRPMLRESVRAFQQVDLSAMDRLEAAEFITGQKLLDTKWEMDILKAERVVFIPNAHMGPYLGKIYQGGVLGLVFGARLPEGAAFDSPDLSRTEILVRLDAMADENRLRILRLIGENGEMRAQDIMIGLDLSQPMTSRHLTQLTATGFLIERRCKGAKCYVLNPNRIEDTLQAISAFLLGKNSAQREAQRLVQIGG